MFFKNKNKFLRAAEKYALQGRFEQAVTQYLKVIQETPDDPNTLSVIGDLYTRLGQPKEAVRYYTRVAEYYRNFNYLPKAIAIYRKIIQLEPTNFDLALMLANLCDEEGQKSDALRQYQDLAQKYQKAGDLDNAVNMLQKCIRLDPHNPYSLAEMGKILHVRDKKDNAETYLLDAADIFLQRGHKRQAHPLYSLILSTNPGHANAILGLIQSATTTNELADAQEILSKALFSNKIKDDHFLKNTLKEAWGFAALQADNFEEAREAFHFLSHKNEDLYAKDMLIYLEKLIEKKKPESAISGFKEALPALIRRNLTTAGLRLIQDLEAQSPNHPDVKFIFAGLHHAEGDTEKSLSFYRQALDLYLSKHSKTEALATVENLLQIDPLPSEYWNLHERLFKELFPGKEYEPPKIRTSGGDGEEEEESHLTTASGEYSAAHMAGGVPSASAMLPASAHPAKPEPIPQIIPENIALETIPEAKESCLSSFLLEEPVPESIPVSGLFSTEPSPAPPAELSSPFLSAVAEEETGKPETLSLFSSFLLEPDQKMDSSDDQEFTLEIIDDEEPSADSKLLSFDFGLASASMENSPLPAVSPIPLVTPAADFPQGRIPDESASQENPVEIISEEEIFRTVDDFFAGLSNSEPTDLKFIDELYAKGLAYKEIGMFSQAMEVFLQAFELTHDDITNPKYLDCCTSLSFCAMNAGHPEQSIYYLEKALNIPDLENSRVMALRRELESAYKAVGISSDSDTEPDWKLSDKEERREPEGPSLFHQENRS